MSEPIRSKRKNQRTPRRLLLRAGSATARSLTVPTWWVNTIIAIFLLPVAGLLTQALFTSFHRAAAYVLFWRRKSWFFSLGAIVWALASGASGFPVNRVQCASCSAELTHAIWVWAMGGVSPVQGAARGGYIITNKHNSGSHSHHISTRSTASVIVLYGVASLFYNLAPYTPVLFGLLGLTWAFHLSFTLWMIPKGQSDLSYHGTFFSMVVIYLMNVLVLSALLIVAAPEVTVSVFGRELLGNAEDLSAWLWELLRKLAEHWR